MKPTRRSITRRGFGCILGGAFSAAAAPSGRLTWDHVGGEQQTLEFRYRADAQISVLSVPLLHRAGAGGGSVIWREAAEPGGSLVRFLEFNGFSLPAQAAGLNRLGFIREMSRLEGPHSTESIYFGLMTSSPEESADQARRTLHSTAKEQQYTAIDGRILPGDQHSIRCERAQSGP